MTIHLELLKQKLSGAAGGRPGARGPLQTNPLSIARGRIRRSWARTREAVERRGSSASAPAPKRGRRVEHVKTISAEIRRLDESSRASSGHTSRRGGSCNACTSRTWWRRLSASSARKPGSRGVTFARRVFEGAPDINGDPACSGRRSEPRLNACQAMPGGGTLRIVASSARGRRVQIAFEDTGIGHQARAPGQDLQPLLHDREQGSGIGCRWCTAPCSCTTARSSAVQPGHGSTFRLLLPQAQSVEPVGVTSLVGS